MKENATGSWASRKFLFSCTVLHTNSSLHTEMNRIWMYFIEFFVKSTKLTFQICFSFYSIKKASISTVAIWTSALRNTMKILGPCFFISYTPQNKLAIMDLVFPTYSERSLLSCQPLLHWKFCNISGERRQCACSVFNLKELTLIYGFSIRILTKERKETKHGVAVKPRDENQTINRTNLQLWMRL